MLDVVEDPGKCGDAIFWVSIYDCSPVRRGQGKSCDFSISLFPYPDDLMVFLVACRCLANGGEYIMVIGALHAGRTALSQLVNQSALDRE